MRWRILAVVAILGGGSMPALAGLYTDDLSRCLVEGTTSADRITLVRWISAAILQHPAVSALSKATPDDVENANVAVGALFMKLLTDTCKEKAAKAIKYEGVLAIQGAFFVLGQVATTDLFADASVQKVMAGLEKHVDSKKLESLVGSAP